MATPPSTPTELKPKALQRLQSQEATSRKRGTSIGDGRWRTSSFSEPGRIVLVAVDESPNSKNAFDCLYFLLFVIEISSYKAYCHLIDKIDH